MAMLPNALCLVKIFRALYIEWIEEQIATWVKETRAMIISVGPVSSTPVDNTPIFNLPVVYVPAMEITDGSRSTEASDASAGAAPPTKPVSFPLSQAVKDQLNGRSKLAGLTDKRDSEYQKLLAGLLPQARQAVEAMPAVDDPASWPGEREPAFQVVIIPDGEWPIHQVFPAVERDRVVKLLHSWEGRDACVMLFYGLLVPFTMGPRRYMFFPDNQVWQVTPEVRQLESPPDHEVFQQEHGFVGDPAYLESSNSLMGSGPSVPAKVKDKTTDGPDGAPSPA